MASTGDDAPDAYLAKLSPKLVVAQVGSSLCLVKGVVIVARFNKLPTPSFCLNHKYPSGSQNEVIDLRASQGGAIEVNVALSTQSDVAENGVLIRQTG